MIFKCSACSAQYQNISLYIKGQKILIQHNCLELPYLIDIQLYIGYVECFFTDIYKNTI